MPKSSLSVKIYGEIGFPVTKADDDVQRRAGACKRDCEVYELQALWCESRMMMEAGAAGERRNHHQSRMY